MPVILFFASGAQDADRPRVGCKADQEACQWPEPICSAVLRDDGSRCAWYCTRRKGHGPPHIAGNRKMVPEGSDREAFYPNILARWTED